MAETLWNLMWLALASFVVGCVVGHLLWGRYRTRYRTGGKLTQGAFNQLFNQQGQKIQETVAETFNAKCAEWEE